MVTREDVRRELWPETLLTNVDANVNTTFNKLRQVLGDSSENPMYVETIPRRGYSFIGLVEFSNSFANTIPTKVNGKPAAEPHVETTQLPYKRFVLVRVISLLFGGMILGALLTFVWFFSQSKYRRASNGASISISAAWESSRLVGLSGENHFNPRM